MYLSNLKPNKGATTKKKRIGRGGGSGWGTTAGKGNNGQNARSGRKKRAWFEGGQMPINRRLPKRGFHNPFRVEYQIVNLERIVSVTEGKITELNLEEMQSLGLIKDLAKKVKILGDGELTTAITIKAHAFSKSAKEKIEKVNGKCEVI